MPWATRAVRRTDPPPVLPVDPRSLLIPVTDRLYDRPDPRDRPGLMTDRTRSTAWNATGQCRIPEGGSMPNCCDRAEP